jgi:molybdenum cofactor biosynthesis enzyme MoaA
MNIEKLKTLLDGTSPALCLAKFHEATIWLYSSKISSCHHTPMVVTGNDVVTFFNPPKKRDQQNRMLLGERPNECNYCWKLEDQGVTSDRELKSLGFNKSLSVEDYLNRDYVFKPKSLELAFQKTCNLACSYCSPSFSSEWESDIKHNGNYTNLKTDKKLHYLRGIDNDVAVDMDLFWDWFYQSASELESIRITGGEPLLHEDTFKTFEKILQINPSIECVIHTNLCQKPLIIDRFIDNINKLSNVRINISNESAGEIAEFIRDGMVYDEWLYNVNRICSETNATVSISTTITALALVGLDELYQDILQIKRRPHISINFATYPEFQSLACLSYEDRVFYLRKYSTFFKSIESQLTKIELSTIPRILNMLDPKLTHDNNKEYRLDSDRFFEQYCQRRNKTTNLATEIGKR